MTSKELKRFWPKIRVTPFGCWAWTASQNCDGYGSFWCEGKLKLAHRAAYEHFVGPIPDGLQTDHLCRNRACANPVHLEVVTSRVNTLRGIGVAAKNAGKGHCKWGHEFTNANTHAFRGDRRPGRKCRTCDRLSARKRYHAKKAEMA